MASASSGRESRLASGCTSDQKGPKKRSLSSSPRQSHSRTPRSLQQLSTSSPSRSR